MAPKPGDGKKRAADEPEEPPAAKKNGGTRAGAGRPKEKLGLGPAKSSGTQPSLAALLGARTAPKEPAPAGAPAAAAGAGAPVRQLSAALPFADVQQLGDAWHGLIGTG